MKFNNIILLIRCTLYVFAKGLKLYTINVKQNKAKLIHFASALRKLCFSEKKIRDSVKVLRII